MSDSQSAIIGSGGSRWVTNPKLLPILSVYSSALKLKTGTITSTDSTVAGFYTALAYEGAASAITVADTYVTVCDLTGGGFMFNAVGPSHTAAFRPTIRITVDGTVYTITPSADQALSRRLVLGPLIHSISTATPSAATIVSDTSLPNSGWDSGFFAAKVGGVRQYGDSASAFVSIPTESALMTFNMPVLRFESSLKVEMKASLLSGTATDKQCGVTYRLDL